MITIKMEGVKETQANLNKLAVEFKTQRKIIVNSLKKAITPLYRNVKESMPVLTGTLKRAVMMRRYRNNYYLAITHGRHTFGKKKGQLVKNDAWYWRFIEFGYIHWKSKRFVQGRHNIQMSINQDEQKAVKIFEQDFKQEAKKLFREHGLELK